MITGDSCHMADLVYCHTLKHNLKATQQREEVNSLCFNIRVVGLICCLLGFFLFNCVSAGAADEKPQTIKSQTIKTGIDSNNSDKLILLLYNELHTLSQHHSPGIQIAKDFLEQRTAQQSSSKAKRWSPSVDLELSQKRLHQTAVSTSRSDNEKNVSNWKFMLDWPVYSRSLDLQAQKSVLETELARATLAIKLGELDVELKRLLIDYLVKTYQLHNLQNSIDLSQKHLKGIETGYRMRHQTKLQLLRAQANLKGLEVKKNIELQLRQESFRKLVRFTGLELDHEIFADFNKLTTTEQSAANSIMTLLSLDTIYKKILPWLGTENEAQLKHQFMSNSQLYKRIVLKKKLGWSDAETMMQSEWADLAVKGNYQKREDTEVDDWQDGGYIGLFLTVPLFSGGTSSSNSRAKNSAWQIAKTTQEDNIRKIFFTILDDRESIVDLKQVIEKKKILLQQQEEIVLLSVKSYTLKKTTMQDLLTSLNTLIDVKNDLVQTTFELGTTIKRFAWETGIDLQDEN